MLNVLTTVPMSYANAHSRVMVLAQAVLLGLSLTCWLCASACASGFGRPVSVHSSERIGQQTTILFGYEGADRKASELRHVADSGICDDPRVQRFVDALLSELSSRSIVCKSNADQAALQGLAQPRSFWGTVADAEVVADLDAPGSRAYRWQLPDSNAITISESKFRAHSARSSVLARFVHHRGPDLINYRVKISVSSPRHGPRAVSALELRNHVTTKYGVMGILVARDRAQLPPGLVVNSHVRVSVDARFGHKLMDEIIIAALNEVVQPNEIVQFYRHASHEEFGDSDYRVADYMDSVKNAVLIKRPEASE